MAHRDPEASLRTRVSQARSRPPEPEGPGPARRRRRRQCRLGASPPAGSEQTPAETKKASTALTERVL